MEKKDFLTKLPNTKEENNLKSQGVFVFDSCSLLSIYSLTDTDRRELISILKKLADKKRIWLPYQFFEEFENHRLEKIEKQYDAYDEFRKIIDAQFDFIYKDEKMKDFGDHKFLKKFKKDYILQIKCLKKNIYEKLQKTKEKHTDWRKKDPVKISLMKCFNNLKGDPYTNEKLFNELYLKGENRYKMFVPPGYMDIEKNMSDKTRKKQFGDLIAWFQIMDFAKATKKPIIIVTEDLKEDWWNKVGGKLFGPRIELMYEINEFAGVHLAMFSMKEFLKYAKEKLKITVKDNLLARVGGSSKEGLIPENLLDQNVSSITVGSISEQTSSNGLTEENNPNLFGKK